MQRCRKLLRQLNSDTITSDEYAYNVALPLVTMCDECARSYVQSLAQPTAASLFAFLRQFLEPVDFMPCPGPFMVGPVSEGAVEDKKQQLRPKYIRLYHSVSQRAVSVR